MPVTCAIYKVDSAAFIAREGASALSLPICIIRAILWKISQLKVAAGFLHLKEAPTELDPSRRFVARMTGVAP
jgi:hypothetical protein